MRHLRLACLAGIALAAASCLGTKSDIDLSVHVDSAVLHKSTATGKLVGSATVTITLGAYATGARVVHPQSMDVLIDSHVQGSLNAGMGSGYVATFSPGDTMTVTFPFTCDGSTDCGAATVCPLAATPINFIYRDDTMLPGTVGVIAGSATVDCTTPTP